MSSRADNLQEVFATAALTQRLMRNYMQHSPGHLDIAPSEGQLLQFVADSQPVSLKELASAMHLTPGAITQLVDGLVQSKYVTRTSSKQDRRVAVVALTDEGNQAIGAVRKMKQSLFAKVVADLSNEELSAYLRVQRKMLTYLEANCDCSAKK